MDSVLHRKDRFINTAIDIIDELGIQNLSTRELAKRQGISEATLYRHYKNKNDLLGAVLDYSFQNDAVIFQTVIKKKLKSIDAIKYFATSITKYYENYPAVTSIMNLIEVLKYEPNLGEKIKNIYNHRYEFLKQLIETAQKYGEINPEIKCEDIICYINGLCNEICLMWRLYNRSFSLSNRITNALWLFLDSISVNPSK